MAVPAQPDLIGCGETIGLQILILTAGGPEQKLEAPECFQGDYLALLSFFLIFAHESFAITIDGDWEVISSKFRFPLQRIPSLLSFIPIFP